MEGRAATGATRFAARELQAVADGRRLSETLEQTFDYNVVASFARKLKRDAADIDDVLEQRHGSGTWSSADALTRLHTLRLAPIQLIHFKAMEIPQFSSRSDLSLEALIERLLHLDVPEMVEALIALHVGAYG